MEKTSFKTVVFITGAFVSHHGWDNWKVYFEQKGYRVILPSWPGKEASASELRNETDSKIASVRLAEVIEHYIGIVQELPEKRGLRDLRARSVRQARRSAFSVHGAVPQRMRSATRSVTVTAAVISASLMPIVITSPAAPLNGPCSRVSELPAQQALRDRPVRRGRQDLKALSVRQAPLDQLALRVFKVLPDRKDPLVLQSLF